jgi:transposase
VSGSLNVGSGAFGRLDGNAFEGNGGNDTIYGNGYTRLDYWGAAVGVDLGLTTFATLVSSEGSAEKVSAPKPLKHRLSLLARRQRRHAKKVKGSANRRKSALRLARLHHSRHARHPR